MQNLETLGQRLKYTIKMKFKTQRDVAVSTKIDPTLLSQYCNDKKPPSAVTMIKISSFLNISPRWLRDNVGDINDTFNDYVFDEVDNSAPIEMSKIKLSKGMNETFDMTLNLKKEEMKALFDQYLTII